MKKIKAIKDKISQGMTIDSWTNVLSGLGISSKDPNVSAKISWERTNRSLVENLFAGDDIAGKIAKMIPYDGTREGISWNTPNNDDTERDAKVFNQLDTEFERLNVFPTFNWAWTIARAYGGACVFMSLDDSSPLDSPVNWKRVRGIKNLVVLDRWDLQVQSTDIINDLGNPKYGMPKFYTYQGDSIPAEDNNSFVKIHESRMIRFDGEFLPRRLYNRNGYWHDSIYTRLYDAIRNYTTGHGTLSNVLQETNQPVFKIEGLHEAISQDEDELVAKRLEIVNLLRSSFRAVVLDKEDDFQFMQTALQGVSNIMDSTTQRLVAATDIPHTRLLGESPGSSLGETGQSQLTDYYDFIAASQEIYLRNPINTMMEAVFAQKSISETMPEGLRFTFNPLYQMDQEAVLRTRHIQALIDQIYMHDKVYNNAEVADNRFGSGEYSYETNLEGEREVYDPTATSPSPNGGDEEIPDPVNNTPTNDE